MHLPVLAIFPMPKEGKEKGLDLSRLHMHLIITDPVHQWQGAYYGEVHVQMAETWPLLLFRPGNEASPRTCKDQTICMNRQV